MRKTILAILASMLFSVAFSQVYLQPVVQRAYAQTQKKILIDNTHTNYAYWPSPPYPPGTTFKTAMSAAVLYLKGMFGWYEGYIVDYLDVGPISSSVLSGYDVLWIISPFSTYAADEISAITSFVNDGGGLFLVGEWGRLLD